MTYQPGTYLYLLHELSPRVPASPTLHCSQQEIIPEDWYAPKAHLFGIDSTHWSSYAESSTNWV
jgi:hypothetical protein